jgi:hypothetical protein
LFQFVQIGINLDTCSNPLPIPIDSMTPITIELLLDYGMISQIWFSDKTKLANFPYKLKNSCELNDGNQGGPSLKDPLQVPDEPITRSRAKKIKEAMQELVQCTWDEASKSPTLKVGLKEGEPILIYLIQAVEDMT